MAHYLFHIFNDVETKDDEGKELLDFGAARAFAVKGARGIMADELQTEGLIDLSHWIEIEDEQGEISVVTFADAVTVRGASPLSTH
jgi:hypothetical protein